MGREEGESANPNHTHKKSALSTVYLPKSLMLVLHVKNRVFICCVNERKPENHPTLTRTDVMRKHKRTRWETEAQRENVWENDAERHATAVFLFTVLLHWSDLIILIIISACSIPWGESGQWQETEERGKGGGRGESEILPESIPLVQSRPIKFEVDW